MYTKDTSKLIRLHFCTTPQHKMQHSFYWWPLMMLVLSVPRALSSEILEGASEIRQNLRTDWDPKF